MAQKENRIQFNIDFKTGDIKVLKDLKNDLAEIQRLGNDIEFAGGTPAKDIQNMINAARTLDTALDQAFDVKLNAVNVQKFNNILKQSGTSAEQLYTDLSTAGIVGQQAFMKMSGQLMQFNTAIKQSNEFLNGLATTFFNTVKWSIMSSIVNNISGTIQKSFYYIKDLDRGLNDIRIVTGKSADEMERFAVTANDAAKALSVSTEDFTRGALIYYQQGLNDETATQLAEITAKTANVTGQSMEAVSEELTAVQNGYQVANQAAQEGMQVYEEYVDKMAAVGATTASDLEELSVAMSKVASAASAMGVDFDDLNAQIATIVSVTRQAPESVGTALKTIYARLGDLKIDGVDEFGVKLGEVSQQLQDIGINVLDQEGNLRDMSEVIREVATAQGGWTEAQRQAAAVAMAGKRQYNNLIALFDNWNMHEEALATSMGAVGTLSQQQAIAAESLAKKMEKMTATAEDLYSNLFDEESLVKLVEFGTDALQFLADFTESIGGLKNLLPVIGSLGLQVFNEQIGRGLANIVINAQTASRELMTMKQSQQELQAMFSNSAFVADGGNAAALKENVQELFKYYQQMAPHQASMTKEQKEQYNNILNMKVAAGDLAIEVEHETAQWRSQYNYIKLINTGLVDNLNDVEALTNQGKKLSTVSAEINRQLEGWSSEVINGKDAYDQTLKILKRIKDEAKLSKEEMEQFAGLVRSAFNRNDGNFEKALNEVNNKLVEANNSLANLIAKKGKVDSLDNSFKTMGSNLQNIVKTIFDISKVASTLGAIGTFASSLNTLSNIPSIFNDEDISSGQKLLQIMSNLGMSIPMLISSYNKLNEIFDFSNAKQNLYLATKGKVIAAEQIDAAQKEIINAQEQKSIAMKAISSDWDRKVINQVYEKVAAEQAEAISKGEVVKAETIDNAAQALGYNLGKERLGIVSALIGADVAEAKAKDAQTAAQLRLNAAMEANPIGAIFLIITATIAGIYGLVKAYDALTINAKEAADALKDDVEEANNLKSELSELQNKLDNNKTRLQELYDIAEHRKLSVVEQKELDKLETQNADLEAQIRLQEKLIKLQNIQVAQSTRTSIEKGNFDLENDFRKNRAYLYSEGVEGFNEQNREIGQTKYNLSYDLTKIDKFDIETFEKQQAELNEKLALAATNMADAESQEERDIAETYYNFYRELESEGSGQIEDYQEGLTSLQEKTINAKEALASYYSLATDEDGNYNDNNIYTAEIQKLESVVYEYEKASGALENKVRTTFQNLNQDELKQILQEDFTSIFNEATQTVDEEALNKILDEDQLKSLQERAQYFGISLYDLFLAAKEYGLDTEEQVEEVIENVGRTIEEVTSHIEIATSAIDQLFSGKELTEKQIEALQELEYEYKELAMIQDRQSTAYLNKLLEIREGLEAERVELAKQAENELVENINVNVTDDDSINEVQDKLLELCNADYEVLVSVKSNIQSDFDNAVNSMEAISNMASKIGEDFIVAAEDIEELNDIFPGILAEMEFLEDGTVKLNKEMVEGAIATAKAEVAANTDATIQKLQLQADELAAKRDAAKNIADIAKELVDGDKKYAEITNDLDTAVNNLKTSNSNETAKVTQEDQNDISKTAAQTSEDMAHNFGSAYEQMAKDAIEQASIAHKALLSATNPETAPPTMGSFGGTSWSATTNLSEINENAANFSTLDDFTEDADQSAIEDYYNSLYETYDESYNSTLGKIAELTGRNHETGQLLDDIAAGKGAKKQKDKSGKDAKSKDEKEYKDEFNRYFDIEKAIDNVDRAVKQLEKDQKNLHGKALIASLQKENELIEEQTENYKKLYELQREEASELIGKLKGSGVTFDESGAITNYAEATKAALDQYNAAVAQYNADQNEEVFEIHEKAYENFKKNLERYESLYYKEMKDTQDKIDDNNRKVLENNLKGWEIEIELRLETNKMERDWNNFLRKVNKDYKKVFKDLGQEMEDIIAQTGELEKDQKVYLDELEDVTAEIDKMVAGGTSSMFKNITQAQEYLKKLYDDILSNGEEIYEQQEKAWDNYLDSIDQAADKFEIIKDGYEKITEELEFQKQLIELVYGEKAYDLFNAYYEGQKGALESQLQSTKAIVDTWEKLWKESGATMDNQLNWNEDQKKYYEQWQEAQKDLNSLLIEYIELLKEDYLNTVDNILDKLDKKLFGAGGLEEVKQQWEDITWFSEKYLDATEKAYEIETFRNKLNAELDKTDDLKIEQKIQKFRDKEIKQLREKEKLTQYDLDAAEARYQIMLKEIALEEAQNNKTTMKLTRNEQGNWSYQYVADEEDVENKQQELLNAQQDYYELTKKQMNDAYKEWIDMYSAYMETIREIAADNTLDDEARQEKMAKYNEVYTNKLAAISDEYNLAKQDSLAATAGVALSVYEQDTDAYANFTEEQKLLTDALVASDITDFMNLEAKVTENFNNLGMRSSEFLAASREDWTATATQIIEQWNGDDEESIKNQINIAIDEIIDASESYRVKMNEVAESVGYDLGEEGIRGKIKGVETEEARLKKVTEELTVATKTEIDKQKSYLKELEGTWRTVEDAVQDAIEAINEYLKKVAEANVKVDVGITGNIDASSIVAKPSSVSKTVTKSGSKAPSQTSSNTSSETPKGYMVVDSYGGAIFVTDEKQAEQIVRDNDEYEDYYATFASGGYTGTWGDENGRLAVLHKKELILNEKDTDNMLDAVSTLNRMSAINGSVDAAIAESIKGMLLSLAGTSMPNYLSSIGGGTSIGGDTFYIDKLEFPNANSVDEIREAILTLPNIASQFVGRKSK